MNILILELIFFILLGANEYLWRKHKVHDEFSRKFIHIFVGSMAATLPFFLSWNEIRFVSLIFIFVVIFSKYLGLFKSIHSVQRPMYGEVLFALSAGILTFITQNKAIFLAAILNLSIADGFAAVIGVKYGKGNKYKVLGHNKSLAGSATFFILSFAIIYIASVLSFHFGLGRCLLLAVTATAAENLAVNGSDNLIVPVLIAGLLSIAA